MTGYEEEPLLNVRRLFLDVFSRKKGFEKRKFVRVFRLLFLMGLTVLFRNSKNIIGTNRTKNNSGI